MVAVLGLFGTLIGSFLNVVVYRVPAGRSIVAPPSACGACGTRIRWHDNLPVLSWLLLRARCRDCGSRISVRYPLVEAGTGVFFGLVVLRFLPAVTAASSVQGVIAAALPIVAFLYLAAISIALALIDLDVRRLPNAIVLPAYGVGAVLLTAAGLLEGDVAALVRAAVGCLALGGMYLLLAVIRPGGMGLGDVKLSGVLGLFLGFLGWAPLVVGAFAAFLLGGVFALGLLAARRVGRSSAIPFGPWMLAGAWVGVFAGQQLAVAYLHLTRLA